MTDKELDERIGNAAVALHQDIGDALAEGMDPPAVVEAELNSQAIRKAIALVLTEAALRVREVDAEGPAETWSASLACRMTRDRCEAVLHDMRKALEGEEAPK